MVEEPHSPSDTVMRAMELVGSSEKLAHFLGTTGPQVVRWMLGRQPVPERVVHALRQLLALPSDQLASTLHISEAEIEMRRRATS